MDMIEFFMLQELRKRHSTSHYMFHQILSLFHFKPVCYLYISIFMLSI
jgi:hypothetical protein